MADANFVIKNGLVANGTFRANSTSVNAAAITATRLTIGAVTVNATTVNVGTTTINSTNFSGTANNSLYLGGTIASGYQTTAGLAANVATLTSNNASYLGGTIASGYQTTAGLAANVATLTSNNASYLNSQPASYYIDIPSRLGYTPVQQGGGTSQLPNKLYIGWSSPGGLRLQVDSTDFGTYWPITANNATYFNGQAASYYTDIPSRLGYTPANIAGGTFTGDVSVNGNTTIYHTSTGSSVFIDKRAYIALNNASEADGFAFNVFARNGVVIGSISQTSSGTAVAFNSTSDYRLKENVADLSGSSAVSRLATIRPRTFNWKADPEKKLCDGFIAHELQEALPTAVIGEKDAVTADGVISPQMLSQTALIPLLTAALKEAMARIESLEARVDSLQQG